MTLSATSEASAAFGSQTYKILVSATAAANIAIGKSPVASTSTTALPPNIALVIDVYPGEQIAAVGSGTISITELT
jgi:hypothetical protein